MRNQYKILSEKYEQIQESVVEARKPGVPKVTPYAHKDGTTAYKSLTKWGKRQDWGNSKAAHKAAGIPEPKEEVKEENSYGTIDVPPEQKKSISRLLDMGYSFHKWIINGQAPEDTSTKTAVLIKVKGREQSVIEVTPDGLGNGQRIGFIKQ